MSNTVIKIDGQELELDDSSRAAVSINFKFEDPQNFQQKESSEAFNISAPATRQNNIIANGSHDPSIEDLTSGERLKNIRSGVIMSKDIELLVGKALCNSVTHTNKPVAYSWDFYGNNADWLIPLKEATLYDFLKTISFDFTIEAIQASWGYDGKTEVLPYVFAPVRYSDAMGGQITNEDNEIVNVNNTVLPEYLHPSLSVYWIIHWAFKSLGYKIQSEFFNKNYFRRLVMPWTWGSFRLADDARIANLDFLAKGTEEVSSILTDNSGPFDCKVSNDSTDGAFDNNDMYSYDAANAEMKWQYKSAFDYGALDVEFYFNAKIKIKVSNGSHSDFKLKWFINKGTPQEALLATTTLKRVVAPAIASRREFEGNVDESRTIRVKPGDVVSAVTYLDQNDSTAGFAYFYCTVQEFSFSYYSIPIDGRVDFAGYSKFKDYKFLDFFAGVLDLFNISPQTDAVNKLVILEPQHDYSLRASLDTKGGGYYNQNLIGWNDKQDLKKVSTLENFSDCERELNFKFKDDTNDGLLKIVQDRNAGEISRSSYLFPNRFKAGKKKMENRFFSPVIHAEFEVWKGYGGYDNLSPQMVCIVSENATPGKLSDGEPVFEPKICYYKGLVDSVGWSFNNTPQANYPYMFAVNYQPGGTSDPILSYTDELIGTEIGFGLLRRFFLQRLAIMRNGQYYKTFISLNNRDVTNWFHREMVGLRGQKWEVNQIKEYQPDSEDSTEVYLKKFSPVIKTDSDSVFPSSKSINGNAGAIKNDLKYVKALALNSDIPNYVENNIEDV
ncbi:MAG TPA: hypothetical protein PK682_16165 [Niabella sp.]|nr:hypothetical protein [Niabella sp.]HQX21700.1 hypothetical protein [Niabella sp.]HRB37115.1 hypothetical protein [Niabella sp.]HRB44172.1 hypothetical protein [Niabella sp.]HRB60539.1 hypothetical protein [Niabella sp.]